MSLKPSEVLALLRKGESDTVEFKESFDRQVIETLAAFANTKGGSVLLGVSDSGEVAGIEVGKESAQNWTNQIKQSTGNALFPDGESLRVKRKPIFVLSVPEHPIKPVACRGRYFKRVKNSNHQMTLSEVVDAHLKTFNTSWDYTIDDSHTVEDISIDKVLAFAERIRTTHDSLSFEDPLTLLRKFEILRDGGITRAGFLLFAAGETSFTTIELGRFQTPTLIKDGARLKTDLISEVDGVMAFIKKHINKAYVITGAPQREERWDYPLEALREIVINAIVHREYASSSDSIVKIFDDRLEVFNPGLLPPNLTVEKLLSGQYVSTVRNRKIADIFKEAGLIEKYGTGVRRILDGFRNHGLPTPIFEEISGGFRVTAYRDVEAAEIAKSEAQSATQAATQVTTQSTAQDTTQAPDNMRRLLDACKEPATMEELMKRTGYRSRKHFRTAILRRAMENGLIEQTHPDKPRSPLQRYRLTEKGKKMADHKAESADNVRHEQLSTAQAATQVTTQATAQDTTQAPDNMRRLLDACKEPATMEGLMKRTGYRSRKHFRTAILRRAMEIGLIEQTHPDKPRSPLQRYRLTDRGKETVGSISREMVLQP